jgi:hypothetical protein
MPWAGQQQRCFVRQAEWLLVRVCGFVPLVVGGSSAILEHDTGLSSKQLKMLCSDSSRFMFIKYVKFAGKQACFPEPVCSNRCCGRFKVSFTNQTSNMIVCYNYVWMIFQPNFYLLCVVYLHKLHEGNVQRLQFMTPMRVKPNNVHAVFLSTVSPRYCWNEKSDHPMSE